jgi:hypothetical protein
MRNTKAGEAERQSKNLEPPKREIFYDSYYSRRHCQRYDDENEKMQCSCILTVDAHGSCFRWWVDLCLKLFSPSSWGRPFTFKRPTNSSLLPEAERSQSSLRPQPAPELLFKRMEMAADDVERIHPEETTTLHPEAIEVEAAAGATSAATNVVIHDGDENNDAFIRAARGLTPWTDDYFDDKIRTDGDDVLAVFEFNRYQVVAHTLMEPFFLLVFPALIALVTTMITMGFAISVDRGDVTPWAIISMIGALLVAAGQLHRMWAKLQVLFYGCHLAVTRRGVVYAVEPEQRACFVRPNSRHADLKVLERTVRMDFAR